MSKRLSCDEVDLSQFRFRPLSMTSDFGKAKIDQNQITFYLNERGANEENHHQKLLFEAYAELWYNVDSYLQKLKKANKSKKIHIDSLFYVGEKTVKFETCKESFNLTSELRKYLNFNIGTIYSKII